MVNVALTKLLQQQASKEAAEAEAVITRADVWSACLQSSLILIGFAAILRLAAPGLSQSLLKTDTPSVVNLLAGK